MTKREAIKRKAEWALALKEGRVVRYNGGMTLTSYPTTEKALEAVACINDAEIVVAQ